jgi:hypothetical protein
VRLDAARDDLELGVAVGVHGNDPGDLRVGVFVADDDVAADRKGEVGSGIDGPLGGASLSAPSARVAASPATPPRVLHLTGVRR